VDGEGINGDGEMFRVDLREAFASRIVSENYKRELIINIHEIKISGHQTYSSISMSGTDRNQSNCPEYQKPFSR